MRTILGIPNFSPSHNSEQPESNPESEQLLVVEGDDETEFSPFEQSDNHLPATRAFLMRGLALLCACSLSIGSHYASHILLPLKSRLTEEMGASNTEFSLLISAFSLNGTWTPLMGGLMASRLGTTYTSILATGVIFLAVILLLIGEIAKNLRLMAFALFIFGLGVGPLAVVQETIIVRFFKDHGLGVSMAVGLVAGKAAGFLSVRTSYPLTVHYGIHSPFIVATSLAGLSFIINLVYMWSSDWLIRSTGTRIVTSEARNSSLPLSEAQVFGKVAAKKRVNLGDITKLDNVFWAYIGLSILCGTIWAPFTHLAANIFQNRYQLSALDAGTQASYLLAGGIILYPICGLVIDNLKKRPINIPLFQLSSVLQIFCYFWLVLPPMWTHTPIPAVVAFGTGLGFSPFLLVVMVPQLVSLKYVSTALGVHKSLEHTGAVIMQTLAGLVLDTKHPSSPVEGPSSSDLLAIQYLLNVFLCLNVFQFMALMVLAHLAQRKKAAEVVMSIHGYPSESMLVDEPSSPCITSYADHLESAESIHLHLLPREDHLSSTSFPEHCSKAKQTRKGELFAGLSLVLVVLSWTLFLVTAWMKLRSKAERWAAEVP